MIATKQCPCNNFHLRTHLDYKMLGDRFLSYTSQGVSVTQVKSLFGDSCVSILVLQAKLSEPVS